MNQATLFWKKNNSRFLLNKDPAGLISKKKDPAGKLPSKY
jgi:hypothetical protein